MTIDLRSRYLGLELRSPIIASAAPHNGEPEMARRLEAAGVGAVVLPSLFEEEIIAEELGLNRSLEQGTELFAEALDYFPAVEGFMGAADRYLETVKQVKAATDVPIIASLNATSTGGWVRYARLIQAAGADALELNLYHVAGDAHRSAAEMEATDIALIGAVRAAITIPLAVKLSPYYSAFANFAAAAADCRRRRPRPVQPLLSAGFRPRSARGRPQARAEQPVGAAPARALDRDPAATAGWHGIARRHLRRAGRDRCHQGPDGRCRRRDDDLRPAAARPGSHPPGGDGTAGLGDRARVRVGRAAAGKRQPGNGREPVRIRARQLHADHPLMGRAA